MSWSTRYRSAGGPFLQSLFRPSQRGHQEPHRLRMGGPDPHLLEGPASLLNQRAAMRGDLAVAATAAAHHRRVDSPALCLVTVARLGKSANGLTGLETKDRPESTRQSVRRGVRGCHCQTQGATQTRVVVKTTNLGRRNRTQDEEERAIAPLG